MWRDGLNRRDNKAYCYAGLEHSQLRPGRLVYGEDSAKARWFQALLNDRAAYYSDARGVSSNGGRDPIDEFPLDTPERARKKAVFVRAARKMFQEKPRLLEGAQVCHDCLRFFWQKNKMFNLNLVRPGRPAPNWFGDFWAGAVKWFRGAFASVGKQKSIEEEDCSIKESGRKPKIFRPIGGATDGGEHEPTVNSRSPLDNIPRSTTTPTSTTHSVSSCVCVLFALLGDVLFTWYGSCIM